MHKKTPRIIKMIAFCIKKNAPVMVIAFAILCVCSFGSFTTDIETFKKVTKYLPYIGWPILFLFGFSTLWIVFSNALTCRRGIFRIHPVLGICYAFLLWKFIWDVLPCLCFTIGFISIEVVNGFITPGIWLNHLVAIYGCIVGIAFTANFCRAAYILNSLEYNIFENKPGFGVHLTTRWQAFFEFIARLLCAAGFIGLERVLSKYMGVQADQEVLVSGMTVQVDHMIRVGFVATLLYMALLTWWEVNKHFGCDMPLGYKKFYVMGLAVAIGYILLGFISFKNSFVWLIWLVWIGAVICISWGTYKLMKRFGFHKHKVYMILYCAFSMLVVICLFLLNRVPGLSGYFAFGFIAITGLLSVFMVARIFCDTFSTLHKTSSSIRNVWNDHQITVKICKIFAQGV